MRKVKIDLHSFGVSSIYSAPLPIITGKVPIVKSNIQKSIHKLYNVSTSKYAYIGVVNLTRNFVNTKKMDEDCNYSDIFANEENSRRRSSTVEDVQTGLILLKEIIEYRNRNVSSWIIEALAKDYAVNHKEVFHLSEILGKYNDMSNNEIRSNAKILKSEDQLRNFLTPEYSWLFLHIGKLEKGVKFLVDLRTDILELIAEKNAEAESTIELQQLNTTLRDLLSLWFSVGFLHLQRVTWNSPCEMLEKISEYEAVHPVRSWTDLKRRVGPYRRCFVFLHGSMPGEPIVVLHTALCDEIASSMARIVSARSRMSVDYSNIKSELMDPQDEDVKCVKAAVFYSITSTQKGLQGIELGNYLIKSVVDELQIEFPHLTQYSSLSPIPNFKLWLMEKLKSAEKGPNDILNQDEIEILNNYIKVTDFWFELRRLLSTNSWASNKELASALEKPVMRLCARYLYVEKHRGYALDSVANFHLRNGAVMWRLNWLADISPRGLGNSCGIMVNYRYFLEETESNSRIYLESHAISASEEIIRLAEQAQQLIHISKI